MRELRDGTDGPEGDRGLPDDRRDHGIDTAAKTLTLKGANGESGTFTVNDATTIMNGNAKIALSGLRKGSRVALNGDNPGDKKIATYIEVVEDPETK